MPDLSDEMDRAAVLAWIAELSDKQLAEFFYAAGRGRLTSDLPEWSGHFALAEAEKPDDRWEVHLVGLAREKNWVDDAPLCQEGSCGSSGSSVLSWSKNSVCPVCGEAVYGA